MDTVLALIVFYAKLFFLGIVIGLPILVLIILISDWIYKKLFTK